MSNTKVQWEAPADLDIRHTGNIAGNLDRLPYLATIIKKERAKNPNLLLLDTGGFSGPGKIGPHRGKPHIEVMNILQYDATVPGRSESHDSNALKAMARAAKFPFLASNWKGPGNGDYFKRIKKIERGGLKIALLGLACPEAPVDVEVITPKQALDEMLKDIDPEEYAVVILSQVDFSAVRSIAMTGPHTKIIMEGIVYPGFDKITRAGRSILVPASPDHNNLGAVSVQLSGRININKDKQ
ncbi:MAG: hypothetical protein K6G50_06775 [bacterium]|nr:hypothetical protein [bacterium]